MGSMRPTSLLALAATLALTPAGSAAAADWSDPFLPPRTPDLPKSLPGFGGEVSCAAPGQCAAILQYATFTGETATAEAGVLVGQFFGTWGRGVRAPLPRRLGHPKVVHVASLSCAAVGDCTAVGSYRTPSGRARPLIWTEASGVWQRAVQPAIPSDVLGDDAELTSVSCFVPRECAAAGSWGGGIVLISKTGGSWRRPAPVSLPPDAGPPDEASVAAISCGGRGSCSALGSYPDRDGRRQGLLLDSHAGRWSRGERVQQPADADLAAPESSPTVLYDVSCSAPDHCSATGSYPRPDGSTGGLLLTRNSSGWGPATAVTPRAGTHPTEVLPFAVSCAEPAECTAVGVWDGANGAPRTMLLSRSHGTWAPATTPPPAAGGTQTATYLADVSCGAPADCGAVGWAYSRGALLSEAGGAWTTTLRSPPNSTGDVTVRSVSCPAAGHCAAAGDYPGGVSRPVLFSRGTVSGPPSPIEMRAGLRDGLGATRGHAVPVVLPGPGSVRIRWWAHGSIVGRGARSVVRRGATTVTVRLARAGRVLLGRGRSVDATATATFTPRRGRRVTARRAVSLPAG